MGCGASAPTFTQAIASAAKGDASALDKLLNDPKVTLAALTEAIQEAQNQGASPDVVGKITTKKAELEKKELEAKKNTTEQSDGKTAGETTSKDDKGKKDEVNKNEETTKAADGKTEESVVETKVDYGIDLQEAIEEHNRLRNMHGAPPLVWDDECAKHAQMAAQACEDKNSLFHSNHSEYSEGQNIFTASCSGQPNNAGAKEAIGAWYNEVNDPGYDFNKPGFWSYTGHFTQVVWLGTKKVGMAKVSKSVDGWDTCYIVANYSPAGNMEGAFEANVLKP